MKVCMLTTSFPEYRGHTKSPFIYDLCNALVQKGIAVDVIYPSDEQKKTSLFPGIKAHPFYYFISPSLQKLTASSGIPGNLRSSWIARLQFPFFFMAFLWKSRKYAKQADIIHCQWSFAGLVGVILKKLYKKPLILTERGSSAHLAMKNPITKKVLTYVLNQCDVVTANNKHQIEAFKAFGINPQKMHVIPNGIDMNRFKEMDKAAARKKLGMDPKKKIIVYIGRLTQGKGLEELMDAMVLVMRTRKDILCYIVGEGNVREKLEKQAEKLQLEKTVIFAGAQPQEIIPVYLNAADALVLPSHAEGRPNTIGEAFACYTPVIASDIPGCMEFFYILPLGTVFRPRDANHLAKALIHTLNKKWDTMQLRKLHKKFRKEFTWEKSAQAYKRIYQNLLR